ncbi:MAG: hypothetical protein NTV94_13720 [Planctomycetota bacterium]|nr:hypothetical protein [Planctomycetota bacterium]
MSVAALLAAASGANAQWSYTVLREPDVSSFSRANCVWGDRQGGYFDNGYSYPLVWNNLASTQTQLEEPGPDSGSQVTGISATHAVGVGYVRTSDFDGYYAGLLWNQAGQLVALLEVPGAIEPEATGVAGDIQVGRANLDGTTIPVLWRGSTASWVNLAVPGRLWGECNATDGVQQVGVVESNGYDQASVWTGTTASCVSLHPAGWMNSSADAVSAGWQVGQVSSYDSETYAAHAAAWHGTAASFVDLHPAGADRSEATGISLGHICGSIDTVNGDEHAAYWSGPSADSYFDLHSVLSSNFVSSQALGIWTDGSGLIRIVGEANLGEPNYESVAVMWTFGEPACTTGSCCDAPMGSLASLQDCDGDLIIDSCQLASDDCNANGIPDSCETLDSSMATFEGGDGAGYTFNGAALLADGYVVLTPSDYGQGGTIVGPLLSSSPVMRVRATFDFQIDSTLSFPGDGFSFALLDATRLGSDVLFGEDGAGPGSISVKFNTYHNGGGEGSNSMELRYNGVILQRVTSLPFTFVDEQAHRAIVELSGGRVTVKIGTNPGDITTIFDAVELPGFVPFLTRAAFGARTGAAANRHIVDNIRIGMNNAGDTDGNAIPDNCQCIADFNLDGGVDGSDVEAFFAAWEGGDSSADLNFDGGVDGGDVETFFARWEAGC